MQALVRDAPFFVLGLVETVRSLIALERCDEATTVFNRLDATVGKSETVELFRRKLKGCSKTPP
jgi:hypothetical protein